MPVKHHREGFTLIELLVVISIIALLIAILLPALSAARDSARAVQCLSNQRQIGISLITYSHEHNDYVPPVADNRIAWPARYWTSRLIDRRYIASPEVLFCPTWAPNSYEEADAEWPGRPWVVHTRGYGLRDWPVPNVAGSDAWKENRKLADIPQPSDFFAVADSILLDDQVQYYHISARPTDNFRKMVHARHADAANTLFLDGSGRAVRKEYFYSLKSTQAEFGSEFEVHTTP